MSMQMTELEIQSVLAAGAQPACRIAAVTVLWTEVKLDSQLQVMHAFGIAQQQVEFAQGTAAPPDRYVGGQQLDARRVAQGEGPEAFVVQAETARRAAIQPLQHWLRMLLQTAQPVGERPRLMRPGAGAQWMALGPERVGQQRR